MIRIETGYTLTMEQVTENPLPLWMGRLYGPLGSSLASWHMEPDRGELVDKAAGYLMDRGLRDVADGLRRRWKARSLSPLAGALKKATELLEQGARHIHREGLCDGKGTFEECDQDCDEVRHYIAKFDALCGGEPRGTLAERVDAIAAGIRVLRTRDGVAVTDEQAMERARNIAMALEGMP